MMQHTGAQFIQNTQANFKSGSLQQTANYIWNTADALGKGATAVVYFGRHKHVGDIVAVKVFSETRHPFATRQREIETISALKHDNIVRLLALEKETISGNEVLVMEYCSGGSLFTMLEQAQYAYGFPETEFLLFLIHIASGMHYLRSRGYIHRDIKPGNIMRFISEDGRSLYKLTDFGAARTLDDDETFMSIYGTEEYLFPKMYERAVLRQPQPGNQCFDASVDIWSLGVTIYHVCSGQLPFQPHGGRSNAATMHLITSKKPTGVISGIQHVPDGQIVWSSLLPDTCLLSEQLQTMLVNLLAGLMDTDPAKMWSFDQYFRAVNDIHNMIVLNIFFCCTSTEIRLYVNKTDTFANIREKLAAETEVPAGDQLLLWLDRDVSDIVDLLAKVEDYPKSILKKRLYLINRRSMENSALKIKKLPKFPELDGFQNLEKDAQIAKKCSAVAVFICTRISAILKQQHHTSKGELFYRQYIKIIVRRSENIVPEIRKTLRETRIRQNSFHGSFKIMVGLFNTYTTFVDSAADMDTLKRLRHSIGQLEDFLKDETLDRFYIKIETRLNEIEVYVEVLARKILEQELERLKTQHGCADDDNCLSKAENLKEKIIGIAVTMAKHRKYRDLHHHEQFIHKCEKQKLQEHCVAMVSLAMDHCTKNLQSCFKYTLKEMGNLTKHLFRTNKVEQNISSVKECIGQLSLKLGEEEDKCKTIAEKITRVMSTCLAPTGKQFKQTLYQTPTLHGAKGISVSKTPLYVRDEKPAEGAEDSQLLTGTGLRPELNSHAVATGSFSDSSGSDGASQPKKQRTMLLDKLTQELLSLERDSKELKQLVGENSLVMQKFLTETSNLHITSSLDSDYRQYNPG